MGGGGQGMMSQMPNMDLPTSTVEVSIRCSDLLDLDIMSKSDPMCVVFQKASNPSQWHEIGRTEMISDTLNPQWAKKFILNYNLGTMAGNATVSAPQRRSRNGSPLASMRMCTWHRPEQRRAKN